jgi:hypothetical protein
MHLERKRKRGDETLFYFTNYLFILFRFWGHFSSRMKPKLLREENMSKNNQGNFVKKCTSMSPNAPSLLAHSFNTDCKAYFASLSRTEQKAAYEAYFKDLAPDEQQKVLRIGKLRKRCPACRGHHKSKHEYRTLRCPVLNKYLRGLKFVYDYCYYIILLLV